MTFVQTAIHTNVAAMWTLLPLALLSCAVCFQVYTIKASSLIFSFYKLDPEILGRVVEEKEEIANIAKLLREKLVNKLKNATSGEVEDMEVALLQLFNEIQCLDGEADGYISMSELRVLLQRLNIHFTAKRFDDAFSIMDSTADGRITLMEFHAFIFPSDASERKRATRIQKMVDHGHMQLPAAMLQDIKKLAFEPRIMKRRTALSNIHSGNSSPMKYMENDLKVTRRDNSSLINFFQKSGLSTTSNALAVVTDTDALPSPCINSVPITLSQMRNIHSGDTWGESCNTIGSIGQLNSNSSSGSALDSVQEIGNGLQEKTNSKPPENVNRFAKYLDSPLSSFEDAKTNASDFPVIRIVNDNGTKANRSSLEGNITTILESYKCNEKCAVATDIVLSELSELNAFRVSSVDDYV